MPSRKQRRIPPGSLIRSILACTTLLTACGDSEGLETNPNDELQVSLGDGVGSEQALADEPPPEVLVLEGELWDQLFASTFVRGSSHLRLRGALPTEAVFLVDEQNTQAELYSIDVLEVGDEASDEDLTPAQLAQSLQEDFQVRSFHGFFTSPAQTEPLFIDGLMWSVTSPISGAHARLVVPISRDSPTLFEGVEEPPPGGIDDDEGAGDSGDSGDGPWWRCPESPCRADQTTDPVCYKAACRRYKARATRAYNDYKTEVERINADYKADLRRCEREFKGTFIQNALETVGSIASFGVSGSLELYKRKQAYKKCKDDAYDHGVRGEQLARNRFRDRIEGFKETFLLEALMCCEDKSSSETSTEEDPIE